MELQEVIVLKGLRFSEVFDMSITSDYVLKINKGFCKMKKILYLILAIFIFILPTISCSAEYFSDIILTSPDGIWVDSRTFSSLQDAITAVGASDREIVIALEESVVDLTIPSNVRLKFLRDGSINNSGQLTINTTNISADNRQIFTGSGDIDFIDGSVIKSSWFADIMDAFDLTLDDEITLIVSGPYTISKNITVGDNVHLKWEAPNIITINDSFTISNISSIEAGNYQIFSGAGDFDFVDGIRLKSPWFIRFRSLITYVGTDKAEVEIIQTETVDFDTVIDENIALNISQGGILSPDAGVTLTINGPFKAGLYQVIDGAGDVILGENATKLIFPQWRGEESYFEIIDLIDPDDSYDAANKNYVDLRIDWVSGSEKTTLDNFTGIGLYEEDNPVISCGNDTASDKYIREIGNVLYEPSESPRKYKTFYTGYNIDRDTDEHIHYAYSEDGKTWTKSTLNPIISDRRAEDPYVIKVGVTYYLYAEDKEAGGDNNIRRWHSSDCEIWSDDGQITGPKNWQSPVIWKEDATWYMIYERYPIYADIALATSADGLAWTAEPTNPIMEKTDTNWVIGDIVPDDVIKVSSLYYLFYHAHDGISFKEGMASSYNLKTWVDYKESPVFPAEYGINKIISASVFYDTEYVFLYWPRSDIAEDDKGIYRGYPVTKGILYNIIEDQTPQLGGNLDLNGYSITGEGTINLQDGLNLLLGNNDNMRLGHASYEGRGWNSISLYNEDDFSVYNMTEEEAMIGAYLNGGVFLYYDGDRRLQTSHEGILLDEEMRMGTITLEQNPWYAISLEGPYDFSLFDAVHYNAMIGAYQEEGVYLYYDGDRKLQTDAEGITVTGRVMASCGELTCGGGGGGLNNVVEDLTPQLGGNLDLNTHYINGDGLILLPDGERVLLGNESDMRLGNYIVETGRWNTIGLYGSDPFALYDMVTEEAMIGAYRNGGVYLYHDGKRRVETTATGITVNGTVTASCGELTCGGAGGGIDNVVEDLTPQLGGSLDLNSYDINGTGTIDLQDGQRIKLGNDDDMCIGNMFLDVANWNAIVLSGIDPFSLYDLTNNKAMIGAYQNGGVFLYHNGNQKLSTIDAGIVVNGTVTASCGELTCGGGLDNVVEDITPQLGGNLYLNNKSIVGTGNVDLQDGHRLLLGDSDDMQIGNFFIDAGNWNAIGLYGGDSFAIYDMTGGKAMLGAYRNGEVCLYYDGSQKLRTTPSGITVTGSCTGCDYVFEDDYELMSLDDLQSFIIENESLPSMTINEGTDIDLNVLRQETVEKIEELTLYILQLHARIETLETKLN